VLRSHDVTEAQVRQTLSRAGVSVTSVETVVPSLEDVFLDVVDRVESRRAA
jgi:hypothetical protein